MPLLLGPATSENVWARDSEPGTSAGPTAPRNQIPTAHCKCFEGEGKDGSVPFIILRGPQLSKMVMSHRSELKPRVLQGHKDAAAANCEAGAPRGCPGRYALPPHLLRPSVQPCPLLLGPPGPLSSL